ncbi:MAG TPA: heme-binding beta-barrel domain-containing protein [Anaeromyxobacteraceae bacterium]|nr:heme-binding beta-barrel domain-containing protein [Anaeromyxobacteraceae bacterium]
MSRQATTGTDIYTEPANVDPYTLRNLGPLARMAGVWEGAGLDDHPVREGGEEQPFVERMELQPVDPQLNGPQLFYGLRYHLHVTRPGRTRTFHDQVGYWLWEPATRTVYQTLAIPRGQALMASGRAEPDARQFTVRAKAGDPCSGILSNPFLAEAFTTTEFAITVTFNDDGTFGYEEDTVLRIRGRPEPFHHTDRNTLRRIAEPTVNPAALAPDEPDD